MLLRKTETSKVKPNLFMQKQTDSKLSKDSIGMQRQAAAASSVFLKRQGMAAITARVEYLHMIKKV